MNSNFSISRFDIDNHNRLEGWMKKISTRVREDELKSPQDRVNEAFQAGEIDSLMHGAFYSAISVLPTSDFVHDYRNGYVDRLDDIQDNEIGNWIAELIQNARDIHATEIEIFISDDELRFIHNGRKFKTAEIVALMNINRTTKKGDLATIGRFGIGFKYWFLHFHNIDIVAWSDETKHTISFTESFESKKSIYKYEKSSNYVDGDRTEFRFSKSKNEEKWNDFYNTDEDSVILGERIEESIPVIQTKGSNLSISLKIENPNNPYQSNYSCTIEEKLHEEPGVTIERISYGKDGNRNSSIRTRCSLEHLRNIDDMSGNKLFKMTVEDYIKRDISKTISGYENNDLSPEERDAKAEEIAIDSFKNSFVTIIFTPEKEKGAVSSLFVAKDVGNYDFCFLADGPWKLSNDRHNLDSQAENKEWNENLTRLVNEVYSLSVRECINHEENFGFDCEELYEIINRPIEAIVFDNFNRPLGVSNDYQSNLIKSFINLDDSDIDEGEEYRGCSRAFCEVWKSIGAEAREWLNEAMHPEMAYIESHNSEKIPFKQESRIRSVEVCRSYNEGIPEEIVNLIQNWNDSDNEELTQSDLLTIFDDIVADINGNNFFRNEVLRSDVNNISTMLLKDIEEEDQNAVFFKNLISFLERDLGQKIAYFLDTQKNIEGHITLQTELLSYGEAVEELVFIAFKKSTQDEYNLEEIKSLIIDNIPNDLSWGRALVTTDQTENYMLVLLPSKGNNIVVTLGQESHQIVGSILSMKTGELLGNRKKLIINDENIDVIKWGMKEIDNQRYYVRTEEIPVLNLPIKDTSGKKDIGQWNFSNFRLDGIDKTLKDGEEWPLINLDNLQKSLRYEVIGRIMPLYIDGLFTENNDFNIHKGMRKKEAGKDPIIVEEQIPSWVQKQIRLVTIDEEKLNSEIIKRGINLQKDEIKDFRTNGDIRRPIPEFSKDENDPYRGAVIRIMGALSIMTDDINLRLLGTEEKLELVHKVSYWKQEIRKVSRSSFADEEEAELKAKEIIRRACSAYAFDVMWIKDRRNNKGLRLVSRHIARGSVGGGAVDIGDSDNPRYRDSDSFLDLQIGGLVGFLSRKNQFSSKNVRYLLENEIWLPRKEEMSPINDDINYSPDFENMLRVRFQSIKEIKTIVSTSTTLSTGHPLRKGIDKLVEVVRDNNLDDKENALRWIEELINLGMPTSGWLGNCKVFLREVIEENAWEERYSKLYSETTNNQNIGYSWDDVILKIQRRATPEEIKLDCGEVYVPILSQDDNGDWIRKESSGIKIKDMCTGSGKEYILFAENNVEFSGKLIDLREGNTIYIIPNSGDKVKKMFSQDLFGSDAFKLLEGKMHKIIECEIDRDSIIDDNRDSKIEYIEIMLDELSRRGDSNEIKVEWYDYNSRKLDEDFPIIAKDNCIAMQIQENENGKIIKISNIKNTGFEIKTEEHEFLSVWIKEFLESEQISIDDLIEENNINSPWWWTTLDSSQEVKDRRKRDFFLYYGTYKHNLARIETSWRSISNMEELRRSQNNLESFYRSDNPELEGTWVILPKLYEEKYGILENWDPPVMPSMEYSNGITGDFTIKIDPRMIKANMSGKLNVLGIWDDSTLGGRLVVNAEERTSMFKYADVPRNEIKIDFSENAYEELEHTIFSNETFFNSQSDFIRIEKLFIRNDGVFESAKLHKLHALHILAFLGARRVNNAR